MRRTQSLVRVLTVLGMALATVFAGHQAPRAAAQAAGVTGITVVSVVADDPADPRFQAPYTYLTDAGPPDGVTPSASGSETYQVYDGDSGDILDTQTVGADGTVALTFPAGANNHVINIDDPGTGSGPVGGNETVTVVINPGAGSPPTTAPTGAPTNEATAAPTAPTDEPTAQPDGSRSAIYAGDCDTDFSGDPVAALTNVSAPAGEAQGAATAAAVETSFTTLDVSLDDLLADDHVLVVFDEANDTAPLACGVIGGVVAEDGSLAFGLPAVGDSRFSGVAYLLPSGDQTQATVFLAENLSGAGATPEA